MMGITDDLKNGDIRSWGLLIAIIAVIVSFFLPLHTSYDLNTIENEKTEIQAFATGIRVVESAGTTVLSDRTFSYTNMDAELGYSDATTPLLTYLMPVLLVVALILFGYELWKADLIDRRGQFSGFGVLIVLSAITLFVGVWSKFIKWQWGMGFWDSSQGILTLRSSDPGWGLWLIVVALVSSLISFFWGSRKETIDVLR